MTPAILFNCCTESKEPEWSRFAKLVIGGCINNAAPWEDETQIVGGIARNKAEFFSIYGIAANEDCEIITDCRDFEQAQEVAAALSERSGLPVEICC